MEIKYGNLRSIMQTFPALANAFRVFAWKLVYYSVREIILRIIMHKMYNFARYITGI